MLALGVATDFFVSIDVDDAKEFFGYWGCVKAISLIKNRFLKPVWSVPKTILLTFYTVPIAGIYSLFFKALHNNLLYQFKHHFYASINTPSQELLDLTGLCLHQKIT